MTIKPPLDSASVSKVLENSQRILVLGAPGSGKSYWAQKISQKYQLPLIHLDQYYWKPKWSPSSIEEFSRQCDELASKERWVMDGNFGTTFESRWSRADLVVYLDPHPIKSYLRQVARAFGLLERIGRPESCREWRGFKTFIQLFWFTAKFRGAHGVLISQHLRDKYPDVAFYRVPDLKGLL